MEVLNAVAKQKRSDQVIDPVSASRRYIAAGGMHCPVCNSSHLSSDGYRELIGVGASQGAICDKCKSTWLEVYQLHKITNLVDRREPN